MNTGSNFFFFGTLMDEDVLQVVLGRDAETLSMSPATLVDYAVFEISHEFEMIPVLHAQAGSRARGVLVRDLSADEVERIVFFEDTEYSASILDVQLDDSSTESAKLWLSAIFAADLSRHWTLEQWQQDHKDLFMAQTRAWMKHYAKHESGEQARIIAEEEWQRIRIEWPSDS